jgi:CRISPR-associated protein Csx17
MRKDQNNNAMNTIQFPGCTPTPLASYLKALGIFRILSEQCAGSLTSCRWDRSIFVLQSKLSRKEIVDFFLRRYCPTPLVSPWNAGSGFYFQEGKSKEKGQDGKKIKTGIRDQETEATRSVTSLQNSSGKRFSAYRGMITQVKTHLNRTGRNCAPSEDEKKELFQNARNSFPDHLLDWLDAAFVFSGDNLNPPPLLLSGGNEGNLDFSNTFIQNLLALFDKDTDASSESSESWLNNALFSEATQLVGDSSSGYFAPGIRGGANSTTGFSSKSHTNPWDFVFVMEGIVLFTGNATKKLASHKYEVSFPFCVKASAGGYASGENKETTESKGEVWLPIWNSFTSLTELQHVFSEGRGSIGKRLARNGVDFAQAVASLGVDRGLDSFYRYGILPRFGDSYFASPLQQIKVRRDPIISDLLAPCDEWISHFLSKAKNDTAPSSIRRVANRLEAAIFAQASATQKGNLDIAQELLIALGECECTLAGREKWRAESFILPIPQLPCGWMKATDNNTSEFRLAAALASLDVWFKKEFFPIRRHLEAVKIVPGDKGWVNWDAETKNEVVWNEGEITGVLCTMMKRRFLLAKSAGEKSWPEFARLTAWPCDITAFIEGRIDEKRFAQLLWGLCLVDFSGESFSKETMPEWPSAEAQEELPPAFYAQLKLCFAQLPDDKKVPIEPIIFNLAANGDGERASRQALRRLHGSNIPVSHISIPLNGEAAKRSAAALLFPLWDSQLAVVGKIVADEKFFQNNHRLPKP